MAALWRRRFGRRTEVPGSEIALSDQKHTIVGVSPQYAS
jgi:hypothetical protein